jgi:Right handed beta helix region/Protein of unknown function (DUF1565)
MRSIERRTFLKGMLAALAAWVCSGRLSKSHAAATIYVATTGNDTTGDGSLGNPYRTIQKAHDVANAGDTILVRGGTYTTPGSGLIRITRSGSANNYINLWNYPGETPVIDAINTINPGDPAFVVYDVSWWYFKGLEIKNAYSCAIDIRHGSNITVEQCNLHHNVRNQFTGTAVSCADNGNGSSSNILFLNNDCHHNGNYTLSNGGSGVGSNSTGTGIVIRGNRCWRNNDNGIELWDAAPGVLVENNWCWETGYNDSLVRSGGDGVGFKLGGATRAGGHTIRNNLARGNAVDGFDQNEGPSNRSPNTVYNNTAWNNGGPSGYGFAFSSDTTAHVLRNNVCDNNVSQGPNVVHDHNSWDSGKTVNPADFVTTDFTANLGARKADGSLPDSNFLHLVAGSDLIDAGVNVGLAFSGTAPDMGAYEFTLGAPQAPSSPSSLVVRP